MKHLVGLCLLFLLASCSKSSTADTADASAVYIKVTVEGKEYRFTGKMDASSKGCAILPDGNTSRWRLVGYDGTQYLNIWVTNSSVDNIAATSYTYNSSSIDWNLNGYATGTANEMSKGAITLSINTINNGKYSGTFSGTVVIGQTTNRTDTVAGAFSGIEVIR